MSEFLNRIPTKLFIILLVFISIVVAIVLVYAVVFQERPLKIAWLELGETPKDLREKVAMLQGESDKHRITAANTIRASAKLEKQLVEKDRELQQTMTDLQQAQNKNQAMKQELETKDEQIKTATTELEILKAQVTAPFVVYIAGRHQEISLIEGENITAKGTVVAGRSKPQVVAVPQNRPVHLKITGRYNTIKIPTSILKRMTHTDTGRYNEILPGE